MNGKIKIGPRELEIINYLEEHGETTYAQIAAEFSPTVRGCPQYSVIDRRLDRMEQKGFILVGHNGRKTIKLREGIFPKLKEADNG
jgi:hypothetical protein